MLETACSDSAYVFDIHLPSTTLTMLPQDRSVPEKDEFGNVKAKIKSVILRGRHSPLSSRLFRPFIIDLESTNGTHVNDEAIPVPRYYELKASDGSSTFELSSRFSIIHTHTTVIKFGDSPREYVLLHDEAS